MKNKKLNLSELKVKSFVTDLENAKENTIKGGVFSEICDGKSRDCGASFLEFDICQIGGPTFGGLAGPCEMPVSQSINPNCE